MTTQTLSDQIRDLKYVFDITYASALTSDDTKNVEAYARSMTEQSEKINKILNPPSNTISRYFNIQPKKPTLDSDLNADAIIKDMEEKIQKIYDKSILPQPQHNRLDSPLFVDNQALNFTPVYYEDPLELAAGFSNMGANCWANSILSMIIFVPSFRQIYERVADHYANSGETIERKNHGIALQNALIAYDTALIEKKAVPPEISQNLRLAFHSLEFGGFSPEASKHEDAWEALHGLTTKYIDILKNKHPNLEQGQLPLADLYRATQTTTFCEPVGEEYEPLSYKTYSTLMQNNSISVGHQGFEILVELQNSKDVPFSKLLAHSFRYSISIDGALPEYKLQNGKVRRCKLIYGTYQFLNVPKEFLLILKRFGDGKITTPVWIDRIITLPPEATTEKRSINYELDSFIVHSGFSLNGGHYICYKKIEDKWIEVNDSEVRFVEEREIDQILHGQKGEHYTSYLHHYRLPLSSNQIAVNNSNNTVNLFSEFETTQELSSNKTQKNNDSIFLSTLSSDAIKAFAHVIWLHDGMPSGLGNHDYGTRTLQNNPKRLGEITLPWLLGSKGTSSLWDQMALVQKRKQEILAQMLKKTELQDFLTKLNSSSVGNQELMSALRSLPKEIQWDLRGHIYNVHKVKFGEAYVNDSKYKYAYGEFILSQGDVKNVLLEAKIVDQILLTYQNDLKKVESSFEKEQLQAFCELLQCDHLTNKQLEEGFKRFELSDILRGKIYEGIWINGGRQKVDSYGEIEFRKNPRCALEVIKDLLKEGIG